MCRHRDNTVGSMSGRAVEYGQIWGVGKVLTGPGSGCQTWEPGNSLRLDRIGLCWQRWYSERKRKQR
jgi:hypothetical protein